MFYYQLSLQYDGSSRAGFQWQKDLSTIQQDINQAAAKVLKGKFSTVGASRTDSGVHALHQVVKLSCEEEIQEAQLLRSLIQQLPTHIRLLSLARCSPLFHPSAHALSQEYRYLFTNLKGGPLASQEHLATIANPLNIELMQQVSTSLIGEHNFQNFYSTGSNVKSTLRVIEQAELTLRNPHTLLDAAGLFKISSDLVDCFEFKIVANGFLKQMIRHLVSALWMVGSGKLTSAEFSKLLKGEKQSKRLWRIAPARGLYLTKISY